MIKGEIMTEFQKKIVALIRKGLVEKEIPLNSPVDYAKLYDFSKWHQITCIIYGALCAENAFHESAEYTRWSKLFYFLLGHSEKQLYETNRICRAFDAAGIDYLPLKGIRIKRFYPETQMREMGDIDILIRLSDYNDKIKPAMISLGFTETKESAHELIWELPQLNISVELHKMLIPDYNKDFYAYFGTGWQRAVPAAETTHEYVLSPEDEFIFMFTHFAKHYRDAGAGIKYVVDFYVWLQRYPSMDFEYIENELQKLKLIVFYKNVRKLLDVWFNGANGDEITDFLTDKVFGGGVYGNVDISLSAGLKESKKSKHYRFIHAVKMIFPPYSAMKTKYSVLKKLPFLLPLFWPIRWFAVLFFRPKEIKNQFDILKKMKKENVKNYQAELNFVGLDYNFK